MSEGVNAALTSPATPMQGFGEYGKSVKVVEFETAEGTRLGDAGCLGARSLLRTIVVVDLLLRPR